LNLIQAIILTEQMTRLQNFPKVKILGTGKGGCLLCINAELVNDVHLSHLEQIAEENSLILTFEQGYWILIDL